MKTIKTTSNNKDFQSLVMQLDAYLKVIDGDEHDFYHQYNQIDMLNNVVVVYEDNQPVGCGAFKPFNESSVEIKRMYTLPEARGKGIATQVLNALENWAKESGYASSLLETGKRMPDAIAFYNKLGYNKTENYGQYIGVDNSICFKKELC